MLDDCTSCPVCLDEMRDPVITRCGHTFCRQCILASIQRGFGCPNCRKACAPHHLVRNSVIRDAREHLSNLYGKMLVSERGFVAMQQEVRLAEQRCQQLQQELREQRLRSEDLATFLALQNDERLAAQNLRQRAVFCEDALLRLMSVIWQQAEGQQAPEDPHWGVCSMCSTPMMPATGVVGEFGTVCQCKKNPGGINRASSSSSMGLKISPDLRWDMNIHKDYCIGGVAHKERHRAAGRVHFEGESLKFTDGMVWESGGGFTRGHAVPSFSGRLCGVEGASMMVLSGFPGGGGIMLKNPGEHFVSYPDVADCSDCSLPEAAGMVFPKGKASAPAAKATSARSKAAAPPVSHRRSTGALSSAVCRWGTPDSPALGWQWSPGESTSL